MAPRITKSLWRYIFNATHRVPASTDLVGYADSTGTPMVTNINECTVAELVGASGVVMVKTAQTKITNTEMIALQTTPKTLLAGVAGQFHIPLMVLLEMELVADYTAIDAAGSLYIQATSGNEILTDVIQNNAADAITQLTDFLAPGFGITNVIGLRGWQTSILGAANLISGAVAGFPIYSLKNAAINGSDLQLKLINGGANLTGGNAGNNLGVTVVYFDVPSALV